MSAGAARDPVYVYGVVPAGSAVADVEGLQGPSTRVRLVEHEGLAALVSTLAADHTPGTRADLEAHQRVLAATIEAGTVVPMRFGVVMEDEDAVRDALLTRHGQQLSGLLGRLDGHVEMAVKAFYLGDALMREIVAARPELARRSAELQKLPEARSYSARLALGEQVAALAAAQREHDEDALVGRLRGFAADIRTEPTTDDRVALNAHVLVQRDRRAKLDEAVAALRAELDGRVAIRYVGPLPPYSWADISLEDPAWA